MSTTVRAGPFCACLGCPEDAEAFIDHPSRGRMAVCEGHIRDFPVIEHV